MNGREMARVDLEPDFSIVHHIMGSVKKSAESDGCQEVKCRFLAFFGVFVGSKFAGEGDVGFNFCIEVLWK